MILKKRLYVYSVMYAVASIGLQDYPDLVLA